jgi:hypothetical protein
MFLEEAPYPMNITFFGYVPQSSSLVEEHKLCVLILKYEHQPPEEHPKRGTYSFFPVVRDPLTDHTKER